MLTDKYDSYGNLRMVGLTTEAPYITQRREEMKAQMGRKWLLHPDNQVKRLTPKTSTPVQLELSNSSGN